jgi:hypothetical protein
MNITVKDKLIFQLGINHILINFILNKGCNFPTKTTPLPSGHNTHEPQEQNNCSSSRQKLYPYINLIHIFIAIIIFILSFNSFKNNLNTFNECFIISL